MPEVEAVAIPTVGPLDPGVGGQVLLTSNFGEPNLEAALEHGVEWVHAWGTGMDKFPLDVVGDRTLTCARGSSGISISEWVLAVMLAFEKRIPDVWLSEPSERWHQAPDMGGLYGRTLGIVGLGGIATNVAQRALPFGMRVLACRRTSAPSPIAGVDVVSLEELLGASDHVVLTAPLTAESRHLVNKTTLAQTRRGVHLVNIARGGLIDQDALLEFLDSGHVAMASLDSVDPEPLPMREGPDPLPAGHWVYTHPRVRLSPHISHNGSPGSKTHLDIFVANVRRYLAGEPLDGIVDIEAGY